MLDEYGSADDELIRVIEAQRNLMIVVATGGPRIDLSTQSTKNAGG